MMILDCLCLPAYAYYVINDEPMFCIDWTYDPNSLPCLLSSPFHFSLLFLFFILNTTFRLDSPPQTLIHIYISNISINGGTFSPLTLPLFSANPITETSPRPHHVSQTPRHLARSSLRKMRREMRNMRLIRTTSNTSTNMRWMQLRIIHGEMRYLRKQRNQRRVVL